MNRLNRLLAALAFAMLVAAVPLCAQTQLAHADSLFAQSNWKGAIAAYRGVVSANTSNAGAWFRLGFAQHADGQFAEAIEAYRHAIEITPMPVATYDIACAYARMGKREQAFEYLARSAEEGFNQPAQLEGDSDLVALRGDARFAAALQTMKEKSNPCAYQAEYRQFDFWLGEWDVYVQDKQVGTNSITRLAGDCGLMEHWSGALGGIGRSMNYYDAGAKVWKQIWLDNSARATDYTGVCKEGAMCFTAHGTAKSGAAYEYRMTFTSLGADKVRQLWELSTDAGKTWTTLFDGTYVRKASKS